jgi:hypothetical protein
MENVYALNGVQLYIFAGVRLMELLSNVHSLLHPSLSHLSRLDPVLATTLIWLQARSSFTTFFRLLAIPIILHHATWPGILVVGISATFANGTSVRISTVLQML